jgi:single-strand DNA-binding protein
MKDINTTTITGRLTADPKLRTTRSKLAVTTLRVAIQRPAGKEGQDRGAAFFDVEVWNGLAKSCASYLSSGSRIAVSGRLEHQQWTDDHDQPRQRNYIVAEQVNFLDPARKAQEPSEEEGEEAAEELAVVA